LGEGVSRPRDPAPHRGGPALARAAGARRGRLSRWLLAIATIAVIAPELGCTSTATKRRIYHFNHPVPPEDVAFRRSLDSFGNLVVKGNRAELLQNGDGIFPAMVQAIDGAKRTVNLESYIYSDDKAGALITNALVDAARRGVEVRVLVDGTGGHPGKLAGQMKQAGIDLRVYHPVRPWSILRIGQRTHRKILVVDGTVCFTGGLGIEERWLGNARNPNEWRDTQVRATGPVAAQMQAIFGENWTYTTGEILAGNKFYPPIEPAGDLEAQAIKVSRGDASSLAKMLYYVAIASAVKSIHIQNAYFLPDQQIREALVKAVQRGVDVRIMVPGKHIDVPLVRMASRHHYGELLQGGVKIYEYLDTMMHNKSAVFDGIFAIVGSINFDTRSMEKNAEESLTFYDRGFAAKVEAMFDEDMKHCREFNYERWKRRGFDDRFLELFSGLFSPFY
jgi:cardiolipin synthase